jgi:hypothetical protein
VLVRLLSVHACGDLIGVELAREFVEARVYARFVDIYGYAELGVCVRGALEVEVNFVYGKGEVGKVYRNEDVAPVRIKARATRLRFRIAGAYEYAIKNRLCP